MNISGNYNTAQKEVDVVEKILKLNNIEFCKVEKHPNADDADVIVTLNNGKTFTIEVKEEGYKRFENYGDLGIDYISSCVFNNPMDAGKWKGSPKRPVRHGEFKESLNINSPNFKWGKVKYSKADLWLFFVNDQDNLRYWLYDGKKIISNEFLKYLKENCLFAVNNKPYWQQSYGDKHNSATFFIKPNNSYLNQFKVDIANYIKNL